VPAVGGGAPRSSGGILHLRAGGCCCPAPRSVHVAPPAVGGREECRRRRSESPRGASDAGRRGRPRDSAVEARGGRGGHYGRKVSLSPPLRPMCTPPAKTRRQERSSICRQILCASIGGRWRGAHGEPADGAQDGEPAAGACGSGREGWPASVREASAAPPFRRRCRGRGRWEEGDVVGG
jgi:hypothetical protein